MAAPFRDYALDGAAWGYGVEAGTHAVRLMLSGVLDRFPRIRIVLGHMGEAIPFWMWRLDFMGAPGARAAGRTNQLKPSEYFQRNFAITTSGVEDPLALRVLHRSDRRREHHVGDRLSVSADGTGGRIHRVRTDIEG